MYLELTCDSGGCDDNFGAAALDNVECQIGGQQIDKHYGHWMEVWAELTEPNDAKVAGAVGALTGTNFQNMSGMGGCAASAVSAQTVHVPLQFWFCRNPGLALPLIALQYHEVKVITTFTSVNGTASGFAAKLWCDYIYLDTDERRRFAQVSHEYLIEQVQHQALNNAVSEDLVLNHPVKELVWTGAESACVFTTLTADITARLVLNGHDRFANRDRDYFTRVQTWEHHKGSGVDSGTAGTQKAIDTIAVYSFALEPEEHQPSGTCNFSRIDTAQLKFSSAPGSGHLYAVNYNVLRIMSGMGGLAYSN
jgi:hypothetical protein